MALKAITGCVASHQNELSLTNEKDKKTYGLSGNSATLRLGQQVALKGKRKKESSGQLTFQAHKLATIMVNAKLLLG